MTATASQSVGDMNLISVLFYSKRSIHAWRNNFAEILFRAENIIDYRLLDPNLYLDDLIKNFTDPDFNISASSSSTGDISYSISNNSIATISGTLISIKGVGSTYTNVTS